MNMNKVVLIMVLVFAMACSSAFAFGPVSTNLTNTIDSTVLNVKTTATLSSGIWTWVYDVTPGVPSADVTMFRINLDLLVAGSIIQVFDPVDTSNNLVPDWYNFVHATGYVRWSDLDANYPITPGNTYSFKFTTKLGPESEASASALGGNGYTGNVPVPKPVPEPGSLLALSSFLAAGAGFLRFRK